MEVIIFFTKISNSVNVLTFHDRIEIKWLTDQNINKKNSTLIFIRNRIEFVDVKKKK